MAEHCKSKSGHYGVFSLEKGEMMGKPKYRMSLDIPKNGKAILVKNRSDSVNDWELRFSLERLIDGKLLASLYIGNVRSGKSEVTWEQWRDLDDGIIPADLL